MEEKLRHEKSSQKRPLLSIITAVRNGGSVLENTIQSIIAQSDYNIEYIVIDGGSNDETIAILQKYDQHIKFWRSEPDRGIYDAFNKGWQIAHPESFILYLGAGDILKVLPQNGSFNNADVIFGNVILNEKTIFRSKADFRLKLGNTLHHQALFIRKSLFPSPPFDLRYNTYADFDLNQRLIKIKKNVRFHYEENFMSYALPGGVSEDFNSVESLSIVKKNFGIVFAALAFLYYMAQKVFKKTFRNFPPQLKYD